VSYRIIEQPVMYFVYIIIISLFSVILLIFGTGLGNAFANMYMGVIATSIANEINLAGTYPDGSQICVPIKLSPLIEIKQVGVIESVNQKFFFIETNFFTTTRTYYIPIVSTIATNVTNNSLFYVTYLSQKPVCLNTFCRVYGNITQFSIASYYIRTIPIENRYPNLTIKNYPFQIQWKILFPTDKPVVCFLKKDGVLVVAPKSTS